MLKSKRAAAVVAAAMTMSLAGCTDTSYVMTYNKEKINAGVYIYNMYSEMSYQMSMMYYMSGVTEKYLDQEVEGKKMSEYLPEKALRATKEYAAVVTQFEELGLELTQEELKEISDNVRSIWDSGKDLYEKEGISKESIKLVQKADKMRSKIFDHFYGEGGEEEVKDSDLETYVTDNYVRYKTISIAKSTAEDEADKESENKEKQELRDTYLAKAQETDFAGFDDVISEYNDYVTSQSQVSDDDSSNVDADDSAAEDNVTEEKSAEESTETQTDAPVDSEAEEAAADEEAGESSQADVIDVTGPVADEAAAEDAETTPEEDPYANEIMMDVGNMEDDTKESDQGKLALAANDLEVAKASAYEDDNYYYVLIKGDVGERAGTYVTENRDTLLHSLKDDDFTAKLDKWIEALNIKENTDAIKRYTAKQVYTIQEDYYKELNEQQS